MKKYILLCFLVCAAGIYMWYKDYQKTIDVPPMTHKRAVPIHVLHERDFTYTESFVGSVQAIKSVNIVPYLSGFLKTVLVEAGSKVDQGQTLFLLDDRIPLANFNQAKEAVEQAYAMRANAQTLYQRMKNTESKAISSSELEQVRTEFEAADAAYQKALAAQHQAKTLYDYTVISAPISGWVGNITATVGEYLSPEGKILANIIAFSPIRLVFSVPMSRYQSEELFQNAILQVVLSDNSVIELTDFKVVHDNQANQFTDSISFFIDVPNTNQSLIPGSYIEIRFVYSKKGFLVQKNWISLTSEGSEVYILKNGIIEKRMVEIGGALQNQYWIKTGLDEKDQIITVPVSANQIGQSTEGVLQ